MRLPGAAAWSARWELSTARKRNVKPAVPVHHPDVCQYTVSAPSHLQVTRQPIRLRTLASEAAMAAAVVSGRHLRCPSSQRQRGRQQLQVACSLRSFLLPAVAAAAVTVTLRSVAAQRQQQQQQQRGGSGTGRAPPAPQRREAADTGLLGGSGSAGSGWQQAQQALRSIDLTLPLLQSKEEREARQLASTVRVCWHAHGPPPHRSRVCTPPNAALPGSQPVATLSSTQKKLPNPPVRM